MMSLMQSKAKQGSSVVSLIASQSQYLCNLLPVEFLINDFLQKRGCNAEWRSPPFYSHPHGYKLCLVVYPNGGWRGKDTHVSVFVGILNGEHDDHLVWPLDADVIVELVNWKDQKGHHERTVSSFSLSSYRNHLYPTTSCVTESEQGVTLLYCSHQ